jgi:serine/threonine-protein kinase
MKGVLSALVLALFSAPAPAQQEYYGAIAYSIKRKAHGWAKNHPSQQAAEETALKNCAKFADDCKIAVWFKDACAALAVGPGGDYGSAWGETQKATDVEALKLCAKYSTNCVITRRVCTFGREDVTTPPPDKPLKKKQVKG